MTTPVSNDTYIADTLAQHRADPLAFFTELLAILWSDRDPDQTKAEWSRYCTNLPWFAGSALECFDTILADPPANLAELMQDRGMILLDHGPASFTVLRVYRTLYHDWLKRQTEEFRAVFEGLNGPTTPDSA